jgi:WD40 repeat protein
VTTTIKLYASRNSVWDIRVPFESLISTGRVKGKIVSLFECVVLARSLKKKILLESLEPAHMFNPIGSKATVCAFTYTPGLIVTGHESGKVALFDVKTGDEVLNNERAHMDVVTDLQLSQDRTYFVTSSKDKTSRVCVVFPFTTN